MEPFFPIGICQGKIAPIISSFGTHKSTLVRRDHRTIIGCVVERRPEKTIHPRQKKKKKVLLRGL